MALMFWMMSKVTDVEVFAFSRCFLLLYSILISRSYHHDYVCKNFDSKCGKQVLLNIVVNSYAPGVVNKIIDKIVLLYDVPAKDMT